MRGVGLEHGFDNFDKILRILIGSKAIEYKLDFLPPELKLLVVVVKFGVVQGDQLDNDQPYGK